jgi:hypothetical protein
LPTGFFRLRKKYFERLAEVLECCFVLLKQRRLF